MNTFWALVRESIICQGVLTLAYAGVCLYLAVTGREIPEEISQGLWVILGFWFGTKVQHSVDVQAVKKGK